MAEEARTLAERGFVDLGPTFDESLIDRIQSKFDSLIENDDLLLDWNPDGYDQTFVKAIGNELVEHIPEVAQFITPEVGSLIEQRYGSYFQVRQCYAYRNYQVPPDIGEEIYANYWHIDAQTSDHLKLFVNLTDVTEDDGPLHLISYEDTSDLARKKVSWDRQRDGVPNEVVETNADITKFTGPRGSAMLANTYRTFHRAGVPAEGRTRDLFQFVLAPASEPLTYDWYERPLEGVSNSHARRPVEY